MKSHIADKVITTFLQRLAQAGDLDESVLDTLRAAATSSALGNAETIKLVRAKLAEEK